MNRSHLRALPTPPALPACPPTAGASSESVRAEAELEALFDDLLRSGERDEESPDYELLEAAVDGKLDAVEAELFASRLAGDPVLQREFDDLLALRDRLHLAPTSDRYSTRHTGARRSRILGYAAAALLLVASGFGLRRELHRPVQGVTSGLFESTGSNHSQGMPERPAEPLFSDSFEGGSTESWSN